MSDLFRRIEFLPDGVRLLYSDGIAPPGFSAEEIRAAAKAHWESTYRRFVAEHVGLAVARVSIANAAPGGVFRPADCPDPYVMMSYHSATDLLRALERELLAGFAPDRTATDRELVALVNAAVRADAVAEALRQRLAHDVTTEELRRLHREFARGVLCEGKGASRG